VIDLAPPDRESVGMGALAPHDRSTQELPARFSGSRPISLGRSMLARDRFVVSDTAWEKVAPLLPGKPTDPGATGKDNRLFLEAVLWRVRTGVPWRDLPGAFGKWNSIFQHLPLQPVAGRPGLVGEGQPPVPLGELADQALDRLGRAVDLAEEAHLALASRRGQRDRDLQLRRVQPDVGLAILPHGSSSMRCGPAPAHPAQSSPVAYRGTSHRPDDEHTVCHWPSCWRRAAKPPS
jgi:Putative transposase of IS4/5 family (DUF4096)